GDSITVAGALEAFPDKEKWLEVLHLQPLLDKPLLQLSNGENKRLQLAKALLANPGVLILDNPFIGLDTEGRKTLHEILDSLVLKDIQVILITGATELPACITNVAVLKKGRLIFAGSRQAYLQQPVLEIAKPVPDRTLLQQLKQPAAEFFNVVVSMHDVTIRYGNKTVLNKINWLVKQGECWNVSGPNGAGKSTLLSLITADNPQAYANKIILFDKQRGTGESIWDIKKRIGFVSPELHLYFEQHATCFEVIASGLFDTIGLFRRLSAEQEERLIFWMRLMGLESIQHKRLNQISTSEQRMALLARALVKNPALLILDEPTQGLDETQAAYFKKLVNEICNSFSTTLIYVSHYTSDLPACIDHFLKLAEGNVQD
ncbi:MAG: ATP-binding cassette domain-containing protein, partial [Chitinophagaceae bacterium]